MIKTDHDKRKSFSCVLACTHAQFHTNMIRRYRCVSAPSNETFDRRKKGECEATKVNPCILLRY